jgi:hypothetical protein
VLPARISAILLVCHSPLHDYDRFLLFYSNAAELDDSHLNCVHAHARGWTTVHLAEPGFPTPHKPASKYTISSLGELRVLFPHVFKQKP